MLPVYLYSCQFFLPMKRENDDEIRLYLCHHILDMNGTWLYNFCVHTTQPKLFSHLRINELHCFFAEPRKKFSATCVRLWCYFNDCRANRETCTRGQVFYTYLKV